MLRRAIGLMKFGASKEKVEVKNVFTGERVKEFTSKSGSEIVEMLKMMQGEQRKWMGMAKREKDKQILQYQQQLKNEENRQRIMSLLSGCTGKELVECEREYQTCLQIFEAQINYPQLNSQPKEQLSNHYTLEPFDHILSVYDHRQPLLHSFAYLGLALRGNSPLVLRPSRYALPVAEALSQLWNKVSSSPRIHALVDPYPDPKHDNSPVLPLIQNSQGFVSFNSRVTQGFDFHFYLAHKSDYFLENEFLLTSCDSAYVMKDLNARQLQRTAQILGRACFSNCGSSFNSVKRVYADTQIVQKFTELMVEEATKYKPAEYIQGTTDSVNKGTLTPYLIDKDHKQALGQFQLLKDKHSDQFQWLTGGQSVTVPTPSPTHYISPSVVRVKPDLPTHPYQNQEYLSPVCFISEVESTDSAIIKINSSIFGNTASLFTNNTDPQFVTKIGRKLQVGTVNVNSWEVTSGITYSARKRSGKGFSFAPMSLNNFLRARAVSYK